MVAHGKVRVAQSKHAKIPEEWTRDRYDRVTDDPFDLNDGGWLLPFGSYKGYGLQLIDELLGAVLTGSRTGLSGVKEPPSPNGVLAVAINPEAFVGAEAFEEGAGTLLKRVKAITPEAGGRVLVPGEPEKESRERRLKEGIPLPDETWEKISALAEELGIDPESAKG